MHVSVILLSYNILINTRSIPSNILDKILKVTFSVFAPPMEKVPNEVKAECCNLHSPSKIQVQNKSIFLIESLSE